MNQKRKYHTSQESVTGRLQGKLRKGTALAVIAVALVIGMTGCSLDDILMPVGGDIPYEQEQTTPPEMGTVDNAPTVPDDSSFDDNIDFRPIQ